MNSRYKTARIFVARTRRPDNYRGRHRRTVTYVGLGALLGIPSPAWTDGAA